MFTVFTPTTSLSLDDHFTKRPAATFFVTAEGGGMSEHGILAGDMRTSVIDLKSVPTWLQGKPTVNPTNPESEFAMQ